MANNFLTEELLLLVSTKMVSIEKLCQCRNMGTW